MFFDLNVPIANPIKQPLGQSQSKKGKGKQTQLSTSVVYTAAQVDSIDSRINLLVQLGYTVIAFTQTAHKKVDAKSHVNILDSLLAQLRQRPGVVYLKRLTIILDEESEKGFGLTNANTSLFNAYDLISLIPTTAATFSLACLTHSLPSPLTAHIISLPLTLPRLPFHMKHTLVRTAIKNGAVFEINYVGALGGENDPSVVDADAAENGAGAKRNWWASARELVRVTKGKGLIISGGVVTEADLRAPRDVGNLITLLGLPQNTAHDSSTKVPKSLVLRAQTRKTYRAVFSEPRLVIPESTQAITPVPAAAGSSTSDTQQGDGQMQSSDAPHEPLTHGTVIEPPPDIPPAQAKQADIAPEIGKKRPREDKEVGGAGPEVGAKEDAVNAGEKEGSSRKKKRKKNKEVRP